MVDKIRKNLQELRSKVIGVAYIGSRMELVISIDNDVLTTINITKWGALQVTNINKNSVSRFIEFENGSNLLELLESPFKFYDFCKNNNIK